jgi:hypothetical protein
MSTYDVANYKVTLLPEHGLVVNGFLTIKLPEGTRFTDSAKFSE